LEAPASFKVRVELALKGSTRLELGIKGDSHRDATQRETYVTDWAIEKREGLVL